MSTLRGWCARAHRRGGVAMHNKRSRRTSRKISRKTWRLYSRMRGACAAAIVLAAIALFAAPRLAHSWTENDFETRAMIGYPIPTGRNDLIGSLQTYTIRKGDTLLDVARWYGLSPTEVSNANNHMDW